MQGRKNHQVNLDDGLYGLESGLATKTMERNDVQDARAWSFVAALFF